MKFYYLTFIFLAAVARAEFPPTAQAKCQFAYNTGDMYETFRFDFPKIINLEQQLVVTGIPGDSDKVRYMYSKTLKDGYYTLDLDLIYEPMKIVTQAVLPYPRALMRVVLKYNNKTKIAYEEEPEFVIKPFEIHAFNVDFLDFLSSRGVELADRDNPFGPAWTAYAQALKPDETDEQVSSMYGYSTPMLQTLVAKCEIIEVIGK